MDGKLLAALHAAVDDLARLHDELAQYDAELLSLVRREVQAKRAWRAAGAELARQRSRYPDLQRRLARAQADRAERERIAAEASSD